MRTRLVNLITIFNTANNTAMTSQLIILKYEPLYWKGMSQQPHTNKHHVQINQTKLHRIFFSGMKSIDYRNKMRLGVETWGVSTLAFIFCRMPILPQKKTGPAGT